MTWQVYRALRTPIAALATLALTMSAPAPASAEPAAPEQVRNGDFSQGTTAWTSYGTTSTEVTGGELCSVVPGGLANLWDAGVLQNLPIVAGSDYTLSFRAMASAPVSIRVAVQLADPPYTTATDQSVALTAERRTFSFSFKGHTDTDQGQLVFQLGGPAEQYTFCLDDVSLTGGVEEPPYTPDTGPRARVNQVGYLPAGPKDATVVTAATEPLDWQVKDAAGGVAASGRSTPRGVDEASGQNVHTIDFGALKRAGTGYTLVADGETSHPFDISAGLYDRLRSDSLQFFHIQRSGIAIDGDVAGEAYARPAGHLGVPPNLGDTDVPCQQGVCDYRLDVRGGWYDAGDHGKYVVNGGIATYQLLNIAERVKTAVTGDFGTALRDGSLRVPERGNDVPDVLDEARWSMEFLLRMQVPAGKPLAGMAHHKIHDRNWTGLPMAPHEDPEPRELHPATTAATLNLAATAAQCARVFAPYDAAFARHCLTAARTAYLAAKANPAIYASESDGNGGGAYSDGDVSDEFYWAAAELYLTTGENRYLTDLTGSPHHTGEVFPATGFGWPSTAALGRLDLATVPSGLPAADRRRVRQSVVTAADAYVRTARGQAYGLPMPGNPGSYFWGSNSNIINNVVVIATAYDLTGDPVYRDGALRGMDYVFGRNALNQSYVTGWGEKSSRNQHSRMYAHSLDPALPEPPAGSLAGGANAGLNDPYAAELLAGCKPQFCYVDHIDSYATNEVAINWNSALAWASSFLADQGDGADRRPGACRVRYTDYGTWSGGGGFTGQAEVTNTGAAPIDGWALRFAFAGDQKVREAWMGKVTQAGAVVTARNETYNAKIMPGATVRVGFNATTAGGANPAPGLFTLNGAACDVQP